MARREALHAVTIVRFANLADRCHVSRSNLDVARAALKRIRPALWRKRFTRASRKRALRALFQRHAANRGLYVAVMRGI